MSYSIIKNDIVNVDELILQIKPYIKKFNEHSKFFSQCKHEEHFEKNLERNVPHLSYQIAEIYCSGRDLAGTVSDLINKSFSIEINGLLKTAIDKLEPELTGLKSWGESEHLNISKIYKESGYNEWSVNHMLSMTLEMCRQIDEILIFINALKASYSYQIQSGEISMDDVRKLLKPEINTNNFSGDIHNSLIANGSNNTNTMTINQNLNEALEEICQRLIDVIDNSLGNEEDKNEVKNVIYELKEANTKSSIRSAYNKLTTVMSNHITIGTAILTSNILPVLNQLVM